MKSALTLSVCLLAAVVAMPAIAHAESAGQEAAYGAGSVFTTLLYAPAKTAFCIGGGVTSALALPFGTQTAGKIASASCGGTWVITPDVLKGKDPLRFIGGPRARVEAAKKS
jgi:hypothetical protein